MGPSAAWHTAQRHPSRHQCQAPRRCRRRRFSESEPKPPDSASRRPRASAGYDWSGCALAPDAPVVAIGNGAPMMCPTWAPIYCGAEVGVNDFLAGGNTASGLILRHMVPCERPLPAAGRREWRCTSRNGFCSTGTFRGSSTRCAWTCLPTSRPSTGCGRTRSSSWPRAPLAARTMTMPTACTIPRSSRIYSPTSSGRSTSAGWRSSPTTTSL